MLFIEFCSSGQLFISVSERKNFHYICQDLQQVSNRWQPLSPNIASNKSFPCFQILPPPTRHIQPPPVRIARLQFPLVVNLTLLVMVSHSRLHVKFPFSVFWAFFFNSDRGTQQGKGIFFIHFSVLKAALPVLGWIDIAQKIVSPHTLNKAKRISLSW